MIDSREGAAAHRHEVPSGAVEGDTVLESLVRLADDQGLKVGITLYVRGVVISGVLASGKDFFEGCAQRLAAAKGDPELGAHLGRLFRQQGDQRFPSSGEADAEEAMADGHDAPVGYIHLQGARAFDSRGPTTLEGAWWRGRIDAVDGFALGLLTEGSAPRPPSWV